mgnify:CR=1 FL=1
MKQSREVSLVELALELSISAPFLPMTMPDARCER